MWKQASGLNGQYCSQLQVLCFLETNWYQTKRQLPCNGRYWVPCFERIGPCGPSDMKQLVHLNQYDTRYWTHQWNKGMCCFSRGATAVLMGMYVFVSHKGFWLENNEAISLSLCFVCLLVPLCWFGSKMVWKISEMNHRDQSKNLDLDWLAMHQSWTRKVRFWNRMLLSSVHVFHVWTMWSKVGSSWNDFCGTLFHSTSKLWWNFCCKDGLDRFLSLPRVLWFLGMGGFPDFGVLKAKMPKVALVLHASHRVVSI